MLTDAEIDDLLEEKLGVRIKGGFRRLDYKAYRAIYDRACEDCAVAMEGAQLADGIFDGTPAAQAACRALKHEAKSVAGLHIDQRCNDDERLP